MSQKPATVTVLVLVLALSAVVSPVARGQDLDIPHCQILDVLHGIHFHPEVDEATQRALVGWLRAHRDELTGHRTYHGGLRKWEPRELESILVPRPDDLG